MAARHGWQASRVSAGACLDAVIGLLPLSTGLQRRAFLELAMDLVQYVLPDIYMGKGVGRMHLEYWNAASLLLW